MVLSDSDILPEYRGVTGTPRGKYWALVGLSGERGGPQGVAVPPMAVRIGLGGGGGAPLSLSLSLSLIFPSVEKGKGGRILHGLGVQVGLPPWRAPPGRRPLSPLLYIRG